MSWDEVKELGPLYALGALDAETAQKVEDFLLRATTDQQLEFAAWRETAALLSLSLPQVQAPAFLKDRLLNRISEQRTPPHSFQNGSSTKILPFRRPLRASKQAPRWLAMAAAVSLIFATAYLAWQNTQLSNQLHSAQEQVQQIISTDTQIISMAGVESPQATAKVFWNKKTQTWKVYINNLPLPAGDQSYQLWYVTREDAKINARVFSPNAHGNAEFDITLPMEAVRGLAATAVTLEPKGGSVQPTGKFYLLAKI
ncbi:MAG TPA: anti-sigma factor [Blastocatellia bacterium]|nr:anti-sigma factor [Blastocatellia bacterium]HMV86229.1 anti-sigma factor [Blastocatellia bacterium]HMX25532.1 anti-sigma factor [Blastocatellia bacterium]HMY71523.1 anti-sigma factor [Blastocatellia bacterium]HMZ21349.1 anti-sigma factor [Blastocatellia bacterium]